MGFSFSTFVGVLLLSIGIVWISVIIFGEKPVPILSKDPYWGPSPNKGQKEDTSVRPFKIAINGAILTDLKSRLKLETSVEGNRLAEPLETTGFEYGFNTNYLKTVSNYWLEKYDWKVREKLLNKYPHFKTKIFGLEIHFQHVKSANNSKYKVARPLLLLHGWPGSFVEFQKIIPLLVDPVDSEINFELVIPSLPGYGFSEPSYQPGLGPLQVAQVFANLMQQSLGYNKYFVQGGDWGSQIASHMAMLYPENVRGIHLNMCLNLGPKAIIRFMMASVWPTLFMSSEEATVGYPVSDLIPLIVEETGYMHLQATKPDTIGVGLSNSPSALAAYILEKFSGWTDITWKTKKDGGLSYYNRDELLDNLMVYWVTNSITSSMRIYAEQFSSSQRPYNTDNVPIAVPTACLQPPKEVVYALPRWALEAKYHNLTRYNIASKGGHFLAFEAPEVLAKDVTEFFNTLDKSNSF